MKKLICTVLIVITVFLLFSFTINAAYSQFTEEWVKRYTSVGVGSGVARDIVIDSLENVYVTGETPCLTSYGMDYLVLKYNTAGTLLWDRRYNGGYSIDDRPTCIKVDKNGNVYVTGRSGTMDIVTIKYNSSGDSLWVKKYYNPFGSEGISLAVDSSGNVYVTGMNWYA